MLPLMKFLCIVNILKVQLRPFAISSVNGAVKAAPQLSITALGTLVENKTCEIRAFPSPPRYSGIVNPSIKLSKTTLRETFNLLTKWRTKNAVGTAYNSTRLEAVKNAGNSATDLSFSAN